MLSSSPLSATSHGINHSMQCQDVAFILTLMCIMFYCLACNNQLNMFDQIKLIKRETTKKTTQKMLVGDETFDSMIIQ